MLVNLKQAKTLSGAVNSNTDDIVKILLQQHPVPDSIEASPNLVVAHYPEYKVTIEAEGSGLERHNFTVEVEVEAEEQDP